MLANINIRLVSWFFLAAISQHLCCVTVGSPLKSVDKVDVKECTHPLCECERLSRALLSKVNEALTLDHLFGGFNCTEQPMEIYTNVSACEINTEPKVSCSGSENTRFNQNECLKNIKADLEYYRNKLSSYQELNSTVVKAIQDLLKSPNFPSLTKDSPTVTPPKKDSGYETRISLCKELKGFHVRTITINRIVSYMAAGDHKH